MVSGYKLLDSGDKQKLEEINGVRIIRAEPRAWWGKNLPESEWKAGNLEDTELEIDGIKAKIKSTKNSKHIGIFPEQAKQWEWITEIINNRQQTTNNSTNVLNLFGYTGLASLFAAKAGASVTHVDGSHTTIGWARENQELSGLGEAKIRWILDDALTFVKREVKRGVKYDAIILDPPSYGRGPKGQVWKVEEDLVELLRLCRDVLGDKPLFVILNMYSTELSPISLKNLINDMCKGLDGAADCGELTLTEEESARELPLSIYATWSSP